MAFGALSLGGHVMDESRSDSVETKALLEASRDGGPEAFARLFALHRGYLKRVVSLRLDPRLNARVDASDIVQEAHLEALRRLSAYLQERPVPVRLWLLQIAWEKLREAQRRHLRAAARRATREIPLPDGSAVRLGLQATSSSPSERASRRELARLVRATIAQLSERDREILLMRSAERLGYEAIGCVLGIAPAAARQRHARALIRLGKLLGELGLRESQI